jgi:hypothetical protein
MELRAFSAGRKKRDRRARRARAYRFRAAGRRGPKAEKKVTLAVGGEGDQLQGREHRSRAEPLGAVELDGRPGAEFLAVQGSGNGNERLILLRARYD